jgi:hypothetical protein
MRRVHRWEIDRDGKVIGNDLSAFFGVPVYSRADYLALLHPDDVEYVERKYRRAIATGERYTGTARVRCHQQPGNFRLIRWDGHITLVGGEVERIRGTVRYLGPCEEDKLLPRPWHYEEAAECLAFLVSALAFV